MHLFISVLNLPNAQSLSSIVGPMEDICLAMRSNNETCSKMHFEFSPSLKQFYSQKKRSEDNKATFKHCQPVA